MNLKDFDKIFQKYCKAWVEDWVRDNVKKCERHGHYLAYWAVNRGGCPECEESDK